MRCESEGCHRYFTPNPKPMGHDLTLRVQALRLCLEGMSFRGVGRQLGVRHQSVINWLKAHHEIELPQHVEDTTPTDIIEVDELFTYVGKKRDKPT